MCEWLGDVSLPANTTLSLSINKPRATAESTSLGETKLSRELAPVTAVSLSLDVTAATQGCGSLSQGWAGTKAGAQHLQDQSSCREHQSPWALHFGHTTSPGSGATAHKPKNPKTAQAGWGCATSESCGHDETVW